MGKCVHCLDVTTLSGTVCDHCESEFCPGCFAMHNMELERICGNCSAGFHAFHLVSGGCDQQISPESKCECPDSIAKKWLKDIGGDNEDDYQFESSRNAPSSGDVYNGS